MQNHRCSTIQCIHSHFCNSFIPKHCLSRPGKHAEMNSGVLVSKWAQKSFNNESARSECKILMNHCFGCTTLFIFSSTYAAWIIHCAFSLFYLTFNVLWLINTRDIFSAEESALLVQNKKEKWKDTWKWLWAVSFSYLAFRLNNLEKRMTNCFSGKFYGCVHIVFRLWSLTDVRDES